MNGPKFIWVCGPQGAGKTTLLEDLLRSNRVRELVAIRLHRRDDAARIVVNREESFGSDDEEIERLGYAGAVHPVVEATFPPSSGMDLPDHLADSIGSLEFVDGVLFEGKVERSLNRDLVVMVTRPLSSDEPLVNRVTRVAARVELEWYLAAISGGPLPEVEERELLDDFPVPEDEDEGVEIIEEFEVSDEVAEQLIEWSEHGVPIQHEVWELHNYYVDLPRAQVVVINVAGTAQRQAAERFANRLRRVFADEEVARDVLGHAGTRRPPSIYIADLADPRDAGTKKTLARIKRCFPPVLTADEGDW